MLHTHGILTSIVPDNMLLTDVLKVLQGKSLLWSVVLFGIVLVTSGCQRRRFRCCCGCQERQLTMHFQCLPKVFPLFEQCWFATKRRRELGSTFVPSTFMIFFLIINIILGEGGREVGIFRKRIEKNENTTHIAGCSK